MKNKIVVIRGGAIGDFIMTLPVLCALRENFPQSLLSVMGYPHIVKLAMLAGLVDEVRSIESRLLAPFFAPGGALPSEMVQYFSDAAVIISYLYDPDDVFQENVMRCFNGTFIVGPHRPSETAKLHATETFLKPLERLAIFSPDPTPRIPIKQETVDKSDKILIAIHPGSGSDKKNWDLWKWTELMTILGADNRLAFLLVGGEAEGDRLDKIISILPPDRTKVARNLPLTELAINLRQCDVFIGHDSGITHLAAAVGIKGIVLWGPTSIDIWRPRSDKFIILHKPYGINSITVDEVIESLHQSLPEWK